ncbi:hypothetical protein PTI98_000171 [Pleurotus ostreatus]|nr:hypothetical protein PTI98_000171 [Pleurotus ostreatus]
MSCKRKHRARGLGCRVGAVRLRGCSRECCPYPDSDIDANERIAYAARDARTLPRPLPTDNESDWIDYTLTPAGHHACRAPYRPKFVCVPCRRVFKPAVVPGNEYVVWGENVGDGDGGGGGGTWVDGARMGWWVAPAGWYSKALEVAWGRVQRDPVRWEEAEMGVRAYHLNRDSGSRMGSGESGEEGREEGETSVEEAIEGVDVEELRKCHPDAWWRPLNERWVRCPGCGAAGQAVGSKFEAPPRGRGRAGGKKSEKAWRRVEERLRAGERFTYCMSRAEEERFLASRAQAQVAMEGI